jgi:predicted Fe-Mo cluster-binding NifX family protein
MATVCIPTAGRGGLADRLSEHFGRAPTYTLVNSDTDQVRVVPNTSEHQGGMGLPADNLAKLGIEVLVCGGVGRRAITLLEGHGIAVHAGAWNTAGEAYQAWRQGAAPLTAADDGCGGRVDCGDHHHG